MSDQVHKTLLAKGELNGTGQEAPASHDGAAELIGMIQQSNNPGEAIKIAALTILQALNFV